MAIFFISQLVSAIEKGVIAVGLFINLIKAFDIVDSLAKLEIHGIRGTAKDWLCS